MSEKMFDIFKTTATPKPSFTEEFRASRSQFETLNAWNRYYQTVSLVLKYHKLSFH